MPATCILIIDDNLFFADKLRRSVEDAGYAAETVMLPGAVETALVRQDLCAVLVNLDSDRMHPLDAIQSIRARHDLAHVPVIGFCGHVHANRLDEGKAAGATAVVSNGAIASHLPRVLAEHLPA